MRDYAQVRASGSIARDLALRALRLLEVDGAGFEQSITSCARDRRQRRAVGVASLAAMSEEREAIEDIYEPFLIRRIGFLDRTPRGARGDPSRLKYSGFPKKSGKDRLW